MERTKKPWKIIFAICLISILIIGCAHTVEIINPSVKAGKMIEGQTYKAPMDGWFVSNEGIDKMLQAIEYFKYKWLDCESSK